MYIRDNKEELEFLKNQALYNASNKLYNFIPKKIKFDFRNPMIIFYEIRVKKENLRKIGLREYKE